MHLGTYLDFLRQTEHTLASSYRAVSEGHSRDDDVRYVARRFAQQCIDRADALTPAMTRYQPGTESPPERLHATGLRTSRTGSLGLLRDLQDLYQLANLVDVTWIMVDQAAHGARDPRLVRCAQASVVQTGAQLDWLRMQMKSAAPQALLVAT